MSDKIMINKFKRIYAPLCAFDHYPLVKFDGKTHSLDMVEVVKFYEQFKYLTHVRIVYQCFGRKEKVDLKKLLLPWQLVKGKVDFSKKNQLYFDIAKQLFGYFKATGTKIIFNPLNACENNNSGRLKWMPFLDTNNVNGIDGLDDPKAMPHLSKYLDWCLAEFDGPMIEWQLINEADPANLPILQMWYDKCKAKKIPADRLHYSTCVDLDDNFVDSPPGSPHHRELMIVRDTLGGKAKSIMPRWCHGWQVKAALTDLIIKANANGSWTLILSTDGRKRDELVTPAWLSGKVKTALETIGKNNLQLGPEYGNDLKFTGVEHMISDNLAEDVAIFEAVVKILEKFFGEKITPRKPYVWPIDPPEPPPSDPPEPPKPDLPEKPPFSLRGEWNNNKKQILITIGIVVIFTLIAIVIF